MTRRRQFTAERNAQVVLELLSGAKSSAELGRAPQMAASVLADGKAIFLKRAASVVASSEPTNSHEAARIAELERLVGRLTLEHDLLKTATSLLPQRSRPNTRSPPCSANIIRCVKSAACWAALAADPPIHRAPGMRRP